MSTKIYKGRIDTIEHAMMAHMVVTITCQNCGNWTTRWAWKIWNAKPWARQLPVRKPVSGFKCKSCRQSVQVVITPGMR